MVQELPRRTNFSGPALIRLLARLSNTDVLESGQSIADRLGLWLGWTDAIALAGVLNGPALAVPSETGSADKAVEAACARDTAALEEAHIRSEGLRGGNTWVHTVNSRWSADTNKK